MCLCLCGMQPGTRHTLSFLCCQFYDESYKHCFLCHPTMAAQNCPWHPPGSQVAGGAGQNQEALPRRWLQAHPHRAPWYFQACRRQCGHYSVPAVGCQASWVGRCLMALAPSIMSGNELRVTVMARNTYTNVHTQDPHRLPHSQWRTESTHFFRLHTKHHADGAQTERGRKQKGRNRRTNR